MKVLFSLQAFNAVSYALGLFSVYNSILCLECAAFKAVYYALGCNQSKGLSGKNLNFRIQYRSSLKNIYSVLLFSEFHVSVISHGSVNLYSVAYLTNMI